MKESKYLHIYMIHGWGFDSGVLQGLANLLQSNFEITLINLPGYADRAMVSDYSLSNLCSVINRQLEPASIILGWSMGGLLAMQIAISYPDKVRSLIMLTSTPCFARKEGWDCAMPRHVLNNFICGYNSEPLETMDTFTFLAAEGSLQARNWIRELKKHTSGKVDPLALQAGLQILLEVDLRTTLQQLKVPTTMIFGEKDSLVPATVKGQVLHLNPQVKTEMIADSGHTPFLSHTQRVAEIIRHHAETG